MRFNYSLDDSVHIYFEIPFLLPDIVLRRVFCQAALPAKFNLILSLS